MSLKVEYNVGLDEIKAARECLFKSTGTKVYKYYGPNDPSTQNDKAKHCVASIIGKTQELDKSDQTINYVNSSVDLFRLVAMFSNSGFSGRSTGNTISSNIDEKRIIRLENDMKYLKSLPHNQNPAAIPTPRYISSGSNRDTLLKSLSNPTASSPSLDSPNKRRRTGEFIPNKERSSSRAGDARWSTAEYRKNGKRPNSQHVPKGKPPNNQHTGVYEVFLFRYSSDETPETVLKYFKDEGVSSAFDVRYRCSELSETKHFVMKIRNREDFPKIVLALPEFTGCRWYIPGSPPNREDRPKGYFNNGWRIVGPDMDAIRRSQVVSEAMDTGLSGDAQPLGDGRPTSATSTPQLLNQQRTLTSPVASATNTATVTTVTPATNTATVTTITPATITATVTSTAASNSILNQIKPLNSPHMQAARVNYEVVVHGN